MSKVGTDSLLVFEQHLQRVPHEQLRKAFRTAQRLLEKDVAAFAPLTRDGNMNAEEFSSSIESMILRIESLKRKLADLHHNTVMPLEHSLRRRTKELAAFESVTHTSDARYGQWIDTRMNRWLVDWMLRQGDVDSAKKLAESKGIQTLVDIDLFAEIRRIRRALERHSCLEALAWCNENKVSLRKIKSNLEFELRLQEFIELVREGKSIPAIAYCKKHLTQWHDTHTQQFRQAMALLAFRAPSETCAPEAVPKCVSPKVGASLNRSSYRKLYSPDRWTMLSETFTDTAYALTALPASSPLLLSLFAGLVALKHPTCLAQGSPPPNALPYPSSTVSIKGTTFPAPTPMPFPFSGPPHMNVEPSQPPSPNVDCPLCDPLGLGVLAHLVPSANHLNSTLVCYISGKVMDDRNPPMALRNGYALEEMAAKNDGRVTCPRSGLSAPFSELRKVFIS
ncbi:CTLH/CRA C-terminal to lish motif domain-containing protein [Cantharellus anzutake]|uniref:CTLH/CRA C-terminal to lish motif domain-containing protein n=1 Tax=Cantharellus anzutake TaxID=1750568 RepID=UPI00190641A2|nr:CTLH/CRA C-terminal to lish motif domain-containing protein [Cantharellus anzutake]KAF8323531.1 CTLH/CRA C-terminal to lish motif domain-containing protein [Cantharellus anzutake]